MNPFVDWERVDIDSVGVSAVCIEEVTPNSLTTCTGLLRCFPVFSSLSELYHRLVEATVVEDIVGKAIDLH